MDYESVKKLNPRIIYGSISGFGQDGPDAERPGVDQIIQGMGGLMSITGEAGSGPMRVGIAINDTGAGMLLANAILLALYERERTGEGQWVQTSLIETQVYMLDFQAARYLMRGEVAGQDGNNHPTGVGTGMYRTADGYVNIGAAGDRMWKSFCKAAGAADLLEDPRFALLENRRKNRPALEARLKELFLSNGNQHWIDLLNSVGVPCGPINTIDKVFADPQVQHLGIATPIEHPKYGPQKVVGSPIHLSRHARPTLKHTPGAGEHNEEILNSLGYDKAAVAALRAKGAL